LASESRARLRDSLEKQPETTDETHPDVIRGREGAANLSPVITPYSIRHTVAVELRKRGVSMSEVAGFMGHRMKRYATTEIYARYAPDYRGAAVRAIDEFFKELSPLLVRPILGHEFENQPTPEDLRAHYVPKLWVLGPQVLCPFGHIGYRSTRERSSSPVRMVRVMYTSMASMLTTAR
jgi:hypothetical protein